MLRIFILLCLLRRKYLYLAVLKQAWFNAVNTRRLFVMIFLSQFVGMCFASAGTGNF